MITRRNFLKGLAALAAFSPFGNAGAHQARGREISLSNTHTGETLHVRYRSGGRYDEQAIEKINHILRCHYTDEVRPVDIRLIDLIADIRERVGADRPVQIISGYRSAEYNEHLLRIGRRVAANSYHLQGRAVDFAIPDVSPNILARLAKEHGTGGIGRYPEFVHVDTGPLRYW